jgi:phosphopantetheine--protein transferase-like protein
MLVNCCKESNCRIEIASTGEVCCDIHLLAQEERQRYYQYKNKNAADLFLLGRTLLRRGLSEYYSFPFDIKIEIGSGGKPFLAGQDVPYFSISHSHEKAVVAFAEKPVGVDVEKIVEHSRETLLAMGQKVFSDNEMSLLRNAANVQECFTRMWVIKEAYVKATGKGLAYSSVVDLSAADTVEGYGCFAECISDDYFLSVAVKL